MLISFLHEVQAHSIPQGSHFNPWLPFWEQNAAAFLIQMELASSSKIFQAVSYQRTAKAARDEVDCGIVKIIRNHPISAEVAFFGTRFLAKLHWTTALSQLLVVHVRLLARNQKETSAWVSADSTVLLSMLTWVLTCFDCFVPISNVSIVLLTYFCEFCLVWWYFEPLAVQMCLDQVQNQDWLAYELCIYWSGTTEDKSRGKRLIFGTLGGKESDLSTSWSGCHRSVTAAKEFMDFTKDSAYSCASRRTSRDRQMHSKKGSSWMVSTHDTERVESSPTCTQGVHKHISTNHPNLSFSLKVTFWSPHAYIKDPSEMKYACGITSMHQHGLESILGQRNS